MKIPSLSLAFLSGALTFGLLWNGCSCEMTILAHLAGAIAFWIAWRFEHPQDAMGCLRAGVLALCFPIIGAGAAWLLSLGHKENRGITQDARFPPRTRALVKNDPVEALRNELSVQPFVDELRFGSLRAKRQAAEAIAALERPEGVKVLRELLSDPDGDTRLFASLALGRMEDRLSRQIKEARSHVVQGEFPAAWLALARVVRRYAESSLPTGEAAFACWKEVRSAAEQASSSSEDPRLLLESHLCLAAALLALGEREEAQAATGRALEMAPRDERALMLRCEVLFALGQIDELKKTAAKLFAVSEPHSPSFAVASYWRPHAR